MVKFRISALEEQVCGLVSNQTAKKIQELAERLRENSLLGRYELPEGVYAIMEAYNSREAGPYEEHVHYIDVQCILEGQEEIEISPVDRLIERDRYDIGRDIAFYEGDRQKVDSALLRAGEACIIMPHVGHKPCMDWEGRHFVKKLVFKIPYKG